MWVQLDQTRPLSNQELAQRSGWLSAMEETVHWTCTVCNSNTMCLQQLGILGLKDSRNVLDWLKFLLSRTPLALLPLPRNVIGGVSL